MEQQKKTFNLKDNVEELDLLDFLGYFARKIKVVLVFVLIGILIAALYAYVIATPVYEATAQIYVLNSRDSVVNLSDLQIGSYLTSDYQLVFQTWEVNQEVIMNLDLPYSVTQLKSMLTVTNPSNTRALFITVASHDPQEAAVIANEYANVASEYIADTMLTDMPTMLSVALAPLNPVRPQKIVSIAVGALLGALISLWVLFISFIKDDKIKTSEDILKYTGDMPMAVIPIINMGPDKRAKRW